MSHLRKIIWRGEVTQGVHYCIVGAGTSAIPGHEGHHDLSSHRLTVVMANARQVKSLVWWRSRIVNQFLKF